MKVGTKKAPSSHAVQRPNMQTAVNPEGGAIMEKNSSVFVSNNRSLLDSENRSQCAYLPPVMRREHFVAHPYSPQKPPSKGVELERLIRFRAVHIPLLSAPRVAHGVPPNAFLKRSWTFREVPPTPTKPIPRTKESPMSPCNQNQMKPYPRSRPFFRGA